MASYVCTTYLLNEVEPGMRLGAAVIKENGKVLLTEGTVLTTSVIARLHSWGVTKVGILGEASSQDLSVFDRQVTEKEEEFQREYTKSVEIIKHTFDAVRRFKKMPGKSMRQLVDNTIVPLVKTAGSINYLKKNNPVDEYTFHHSVNTGIIAGVMAHWLGYQEKALEEIIAAGLLHDIGKTQIPLTILNKKGKLTKEEMQVMQLHTTHGYKLIAESNEFSMDVALAALQHHERMNGSGYPARVLQNKIHPYAKLIAIADIYDAMTSDRVYQRKSTPFVVMETLMQQMFGELDPDICSIFCSNMQDCFVGYLVQLNDGREAEVVYVNREKITRPVVRTREGQIIGLEKARELEITEVLH
jgi:putative nucleotidyltransferase with HDIG domain